MIKCFNFKHMKKYYFSFLILLIIYVDHLTPKVIEKKEISILNNKEIINHAIKDTTPYNNLEELRLDYSGFSPKVTHWSSYGSAVLYYLNIGWKLGYFSIHLPDHEVVIDENGKVITVRDCGSTESTCKQIPPDDRAFFVIGNVFYLTLNNTYEPIPSHNINGVWKNGDSSSIEIMNNCFIASTKDMLGNQLTIEPFTKHGVSNTFKDKYGYYIAEKIVFQLEGFTFGSLHRVSRKEFFQQSCETLDSFK